MTENYQNSMKLKVFRCLYLNYLLSGTKVYSPSENNCLSNLHSWQVSQSYTNPSVHPHKSIPLFIIRMFNCFCASLLHTQFTLWCHATSCIERAHCWRNLEIHLIDKTLSGAKSKPWTMRHDGILGRQYWQACYSVPYIDIQGIFIPKNVLK